MSSQLVLIVWLLALTLGTFVFTRATARQRWRKIVIPGLIGVWGLGGVFLTLTFLGHRSFFNAVELGDLVRVKSLLADNPNLIRSTTFLGNTGLHVAVTAGHLDMVELLINAGSDVNAKGDSATPLHLAAASGNVPIASALLDAGARVDSLGYRHNETPLHVAALHGRAELARLLLEHRANADAENMLHETPLQIAKKYRQEAVVAVLENWDSKSHRTPIKDATPSDLKPLSLFGGSIGGSAEPPHWGMWVYKGLACAISRPGRVAASAAVQPRLPGACDFAKCLVQQAHKLAQLAQGKTYRVLSRNCNSFAFDISKRAMPILKNLQSTSILKRQSATKTALCF